MELVILVGLGAVMWFSVIAPQRRRVRDHQELIREVGPGDRIVTTGGLHGTIVEVSGEQVMLELAPGVVVELARMAVLRREPEDALEDETADDLDDTADAESDPSDDPEDGE